MSNQNRRGGGCGGVICNLHPSKGWVWRTAPPPCAVNLTQKKRDPRSRQQPPIRQQWDARDSFLMWLTSVSRHAALASSGEGGRPPRPSRGCHPPTPRKLTSGWQKQGEIHLPKGPEANSLGGKSVDPTTQKKSSFLGSPNRGCQNRVITQKSHCRDPRFCHDGF